VRGCLRAPPRAADADALPPSGVRGYPTILYFKKGSSTAEKYSGARDLASFASWIDAKA